MAGAASLCVGKVQNSDGTSGNFALVGGGTKAKTAGGMLVPVLTDSDGIQLAKQAFGQFGIGQGASIEYTGTITANAAAALLFTVFPSLVLSIPPANPASTVGLCVNGGTLMIGFTGGVTPTATVGHPITNGSVVWIPVAWLTANTLLFSTSNLTITAIVAY